MAYTSCPSRRSPSRRRGQHTHYIKSGGSANTPTRVEHVKIRGGAQIATMEPVQAPDKDDAVVIATVELDQVPKDQQRVLWGVAERLGPELSKEERDRAITHYCMMYSDIFASCDTDLGRTSKREY